MRKAIMCFVALLAIAAAAAGPVRGQNSYNVTFGGFYNSDMNITVSVPSLPQTFTEIDGYSFQPWQVLNDESGSEFTSVSVTSGGNGKVSANMVDWSEMTITVSGPFEGTATIHVEGHDNNENPLSRDITVSCVALHTVTFGEGTEDVGNWSITPAEAATNTGVTEGTVVTVKYNGTSRINSIELKSKMLTTPLTMEAITDGNVMVQSPKSGMQYTLNGGAKTAVTSAAITVAAGDKVAFYGNGTNITSYNGTRIYGGTADVKVYGNIMSLVDETGFATATTLSVENQFYNLFKGNYHLKDASGLLLPATTLANDCYSDMFSNCHSLTAAPAVLPATTLAEACYSDMFHDCTGLTEAPVLPAQTLVSGCYNAMFTNCWKLNSVTCLATSGINQSNSTSNWLQNAGTDQSVTTKTFNAVSTAEWPTSNNGIPSGWTRQAIGAQSTPEPVTLVPTGNTNEWTFTMPADNMLLMLNYAPAHTVRFADGNNGWQVQDVTAATSATAPAVLQNVIAGDSLVVTAPATLPGKVKSVKAVKYVPPVVITWNSTNVFNSAHENEMIINSEWDSDPLTYEGVTISISGEEVSSFHAYNEHDQAGSLTCFGEDGDSFTFTAPAGKKFCKIEIIDDWSITFTNYGDWTQPADNKVVWSGTAANAVTLGTVYTSAHYLNSIVFTLIDD